jgi:hypothetical protein
MLFSLISFRASLLYWVWHWTSLIRNTRGRLFESIISTCIQRLVFKRASDGPGPHRVNFTNINRAKMG